MKKKILAFFVLLAMMTSLLPVSAFASANEMRGVWMATVYGLDFPTVKNDPEAQMAEYVEKLDKMQALGINTMIVQVRPTADALYKSKINPWSAVLTGTQGQDPGYDPLAFMVEQTHARGMKIYAWLNPYRITTSGADVTALADGHPAKEHPDWVISYNNALFYDPANDEVKQHIADTVKEIVENYDVDGIQFDDYFYPSGYSTAMQDTEAEADARREEVNEMIELVSNTIEATDPSVSFGVSPMGIWKNSSNDPNGSATSGSEGYYAVCADALTWIKEGWVDYIAPQIYWETGNQYADYTTLVKWWKQQVQGTGVKLYIGQGIYKDTVASEITTELTINSICQADGSIFYRMANLLENRQGCADAIQSYYETLSNQTTATPGKDENTSSGQPTATQKDAVVSTHKVTVNGTPIVCSIYNIDGRNYFKLRDIAMALKGTQKEFSLTWYEDQFAMDLIPGDTYEPDGSELQKDALTNQKAVTSRATIMLNGKKETAEAYTIADRTYFKLQDLGRLLNVSVYWNEASSTVEIDTSKSYEA